MATHTESPTIQLEAVCPQLEEPQTITERPKPYVPREPPKAEIVHCHRCGQPMQALRVKDAGWLHPINHGTACEDGEDILGYACMDLACLDGKYDR